MQTVSRLTQIFQPTHYDLSLTLNRVARTFSGTVSITGTTPKQTPEIRLHAKDLQITSALVDGKAAAFSYEENDELVISHPEIIAGDHLVVLQYDGVITDTMNGIYPCYYEVDGAKKELLATQFESHYARQAFPCVDEPEAKATYDLTLSTELGVTVLSNMPVAQQNTEGELLVTKFETTPRMSSYLLAWVVGDLHRKTATSKGGVEVSVWATPAQPAEALDFGLDIATRAIDFFDEYFGVPYPLPKSDHVALPDFSSGAMENWGLITYREIALLADPKHATLAMKQRAATVIAHELSHQWFGNLVTMKWWNDLWLNESFANMMEYVAIDALEPGWDIWLEFATSEVLSALRRDSLDGIQAIQTDVNHPDEINTIFDPSIVYAKGGRTLRMLEAYIGTDAFRAGLKQYFQTFAYTNTVADDLWGCFSSVSGKDVGTFMNAWIANPGFPVVTATRHENTIHLSQERFFVGEHEPSTTLWPIPLHATSSVVPAVLDTKEVAFTYDTNDLFYLNSGSTAHFITKYDEALLLQIIAAIPSLPAVDRLQILHEQTLLAQSGAISSASLIPLLGRYAEETDESVWGIIALAINELKRFVEPDTEAEAKLRQLARELATAQYIRLGWEEVNGESESDTKLRSLIIGLMLYGQDPETEAIAKKLYFETEPDLLSPELRSAILGNAVRNEYREDTVKTLLDLYVATSNSELQDDIAGALTSTKSSSVAALLAGKLKDSTVIRPQDFTHWFAWLLRNRYSRDFMWEWTQKEWGWIFTTFNDDSHFDMFPRYIASALATKEQLDSYTKFFTPLLDNISLKRNILIGITELGARVALLERDTPLVQKALLDL